MRILLIHNYYQQWGGEDVYFDSLTKLLREKGNEVTTYTKKSSEIQNFRDKVKTSINMFTNPYIENELTMIIKSFKPDVAHFNNIYPLITPLGYQVCQRLNVPIIQTIHTYRLMCPKGTLFREGKICELCVDKNFFYPSIKYGCYHNSKLASLIYGFSNLFNTTNNLIKSIDKFIFPSNFTKNYYIKHLDISLDKTAVIPHFTRVIRTKIINNKVVNKYFLFVGRLSEEKGILWLLETVKDLPFIKLIVIGDGPLREKVLNFKKYENINILLFQNRKTIYKYIKNAMAVIIPSPWYEVGPMVLIESYAGGIPVIVPNHGVFKERVVNKKTGFFYNSEDLLSFKNAAILVMNMTTSNKNFMSNQILKQFNKYYSPDNYYKKIMKEYTSLI